MRWIPTKQSLSKVIVAFVIVIVQDDLSPLDWALSESEVFLFVVRVKASVQGASLQRLGYWWWGW